MANIAHASLTGSELHEPKGASSAALGTVYVSDGAGSGNWQSVGTSAFTGMIADFASPVAPAGWLELDGSTISTSTYSGLFAVMSISSSGTRTNASAVITSIPSTSTFRVGYYVFGTGISTGTTILSIDSATQITLSATASSSGTSSFDVSPWLMNTGTVKLPDLTTSGRFRRSRTSATKVGDLQTDQNKSHNHTGTLTSGVQSADHVHVFSGTTGLENQSLSHAHTQNANTIYSGSGVGVGGGGAFGVTASGFTSSNSPPNHNHSFSGTTGGISAVHSHSVTIPSDGGTEARPVSLVVLTCIKT